MIKLRPYQQAAKDRVYKVWNFSDPKSSEHQAVMLQLPTGGGKTIIFNNIAHDFVSRGVPVLIVAHRQELIIQADTKYRKAYPETGATDIIMGATARMFWPKLKVGSVQTLSRRINLEEPSKDKLKFPEEPGLVIFDEGHHATASTYRKVIDRFPDALILFVTATPCKLDNTGFRDICDHLVIGPTVKELERMWEADEKSFTGLVTDRILNVSLTNKVWQTKKIRGDFDSSELNGLLNSDRVCQNVVDIWKDRSPGKKTIAFCVKGSRGQESQNQRLARVFRENGITAACITGETPDEERKRTLRLFERGEIQVLTNCEVFTEGFDLPGIETTLLLRPTLSTSLYIQMVGRGKRPAGPNKEEHLLIDFSGNVAAHGPPNADREWTLDGVTRVKSAKEPMVNIQGKLFPLDRIPPEYDGTLFFEIVELEEDFRVYHFESVFRSFVQAGRSERSAAYKAYAHFIGKVEGEPTKTELEYIANAAGYKQGWIMANLTRFNTFAKYLAMTDDLEKVDKMRAWLDSKFRFKPGEGQTLGPKSAGYDTLEKKLKKREKWLVKQIEKKKAEALKEAGKVRRI